MSMTICQNEHCRGGIGPHMTDECPWMKGGDLKLTTKSVLPSKQQEQMRRIKAARLELQAALNDHVHIPIMRHSGSECVICDKDLGLWCQESPDNTCHYYSVKEPQIYDEKPRYAVELVTGEMHILPKYYKDTYETEDCCIFCGQPEERK